MIRTTGRLRATFLLVACAAFASPSPAQDPASALFAKAAQYQEVSLSPRGDYVSVTTPFEDRRALTIIKLSGNFDRNVIKFGPREQPFNIVWTDDSRLVVEKAKDYGFLVGNLLSTGDVYAANADATKQIQLFGYVPDDFRRRSQLKDEGSVSFMSVIPETQGETLFYFSPYLTGNSSEATSVFRVNSHTGHREEIERFNATVDFVADRAGTPRVATSRLLDGTEVVRYRRLGTDKDWTTAPQSLAGKNLDIFFFDPDNDHAYGQVSDHGEPAALYRFSMADGTRVKLASHPHLEVDSLERAGRIGPPISVTYTSGRPKVEYLDPKSEWAQLHASLLKSFPGQLVEFLGVTKDENKLLFLVYSDRHPGAYYVFDHTTKRPQLLFEAMEWIDPAKMSPMTPIEFKNRGGDTLFGYYSAPLGKQGALPLVVMPHGGPFDVEDHWGYDSDVQFLTSLGYAVLQVNYRGSGQRGDNFQSMAYAQWGTGIQDDITDGVKHLIAEKLVDAEKVCIYGVSFGAYSAMMNPIRNPGMYKCSIGYAGVYDLERHYADRDASKQGRAFWERTMGDEATRLAQSPSRMAAKLDVPMLLIHGKADYIAPFKQYEIAVAALKAAGKPFETLEKANEGHGFYIEANRVEAYERIRGFLIKHNPPN